MDFLITLPPELVRTKIIDAYVDDIVSGNSELPHVNRLVNELIAQGYNRMGISCLFMHETTVKFIRNKIRLKIDSDFINAAFAFPLCQN